ncbi:peptidase, U32 family [Catonella morbi ATCC 51271]|uniref:Peptidase, U32 family n=1 Tax=Catonella morbi ATCC 51271 TaxID=592026 RepID=V2ZBR5_9FIRM|nr:peptidase, U32 family [Catonella morbi ATCC 51271]
MAWLYQLKSKIRMEDWMEENLVIKKPELLIPASCLEVLKLAVKYGADAVYIGGEMYGLRAKAKNFSKEDMAEGIKYAHEKGKKVFVTANITAHDKDLEGVREYFKELKEIKPDAIIISDPGVFMLAKEITPEIDIHISTQANNVNYADFNFWYGLGATRVVSARELSLDEIAEIRNHIPADREIETFVHGAMCMAYSGRCLLSNYMTGRDANQGACTHPCRWKYHVVEENRPGEYMPIEENERGTYIFNSKDLCMIDYVPELVKAGIDSFKIEGRMKTALYVATVARTYRKAIDDWFESATLFEANKGWYAEEIKKCTYRNFTTGFFFDKPDSDSQIYDNNTYVTGCKYFGYIDKVNEDGTAIFEQKNKFGVGDKIQIMKADGRDVNATVLKMWDENGAEIESCPHPQSIVKIKFDADVEVMDIMRSAEAE